jgi:HD superfamily phosphodiesterase
MDRDYNSLVLAGLLHDIGKFMQRTEKRKEKEGVCVDYLFKYI